MPETAVAALHGVTALWQHPLLLRILALESSSLALGGKTNGALCLVYFKLEDKASYSVLLLAVSFPFRSW